MRLDFGASKEAVLDKLTAEARAVWGPERAEADSQTILNTAKAIWRLLQHPLDLTNEMPE